MNAKTTPPSSPHADELQPMKSLEEMIAEQGVAQTATFERLLGSGTALWADDVEFDTFVQRFHAIRHEKG